MRRGRLSTSVMLCTIIGLVPFRVVAAEGDAAEVWQSVLDLSTTASAMHIVAHPDDEDAGTLTYLRRKLGVRTQLLSLTRGEGGANLIAPFFFDALGVLRTLEMQRACDAYGAELYFTSAADYGYSKRLEEALEKWGGDEEIVRQVVEVVRRERPDIIFSRFRGDRYDGHGHHVLAGIIARKVFEAAGDPTRFPEQIAAGLEAWQPLKLYTNNIRPRRREEDKDRWTVQVDSGEFDPLRGRSYSQLGRFGFGFHRSQGIMNHEGAAGPSIAYYRLQGVQLPGYDAPEREESFFDGVQLTLGGLGPEDRPEWVVAALRKLQAAADRAREEIDLRRPERIVPALVEGLRGLRSILTRLSNEERDSRFRQVQFVLERKELQFERAIALALGLRLQASAARESLSSSSPFSRSESFEHACPGDTFAVHANLILRRPGSVSVHEISLDGPPESEITRASPAPTAKLAYNESARASFEVTLAAETPLTRPYWRRASIHETYYTLHVGREASFRTLPLPAPPLSARGQVLVDGELVRLRAPVRLTLRDLESGTQHPPLVVAPRLSVRFASGQGVLPLERASSPYRVEVALRTQAKGPIQGQLALKLPDGWSAEPELEEFSFTKEGEETRLEFSVRAPEDAKVGAYRLRAVASATGRDYERGFVTVTAPDVGRFDLYAPAEHSVRVVDVEIASGLQVGYIMGSGDEIPPTLRSLGVDVRLLEEADLATAELKRFDTIVVGVRAYAVRDDLKRYNARLLSYVAAGGVLIVQYQTPEFDRNFGPYPYSMGRAEEVSEEDAPVKVLQPDHALFTTPNRIGAGDFEGWVEQRGSKFWQSWDERYTPLLESQDGGQSPQRGGMLIARHGEGLYLYSAYAWYRQLPHAVPGAFRIYANMLSLGKRTK